MLFPTTEYWRLVHKMVSTLFLVTTSTICEGLPGVYSTIWCLCYKTNKLKKRREEGGQWAESNRPGKGVTPGQHRGSPVGHRGIASPPVRARVRSVGTARARRRHAVERGHVAQRQPNQAGGSQNTGGTVEARTSGVQ